VVEGEGGRLGEGMWIWESVSPASSTSPSEGIEGKWVFRPTHSTAISSDNDQVEPPSEPVFSQQARTQHALDQIASTSIWPGEYLDIVPTISGKGSSNKNRASKSGPVPSAGTKGKEGMEEDVLTFDDLGGVGVGDEDEAIWGEIGTGEGGLFDDVVYEVKQGSTATSTSAPRGVVKVARPEVERQEEPVVDMDVDVAGGLGDDDLFDLAPVNVDVEKPKKPVKTTAQREKESSTSPLFGSRSLPGRTTMTSVPTSIKKQKKGEALPSDISSDFIDDHDDLEDDSSDRPVKNDEPVLFKKGATIKDVVNNEKKKGLAVLSSLGFDLGPSDDKVVPSYNKARDDESSDESDWAPTSAGAPLRLRGGAADIEMKDQESSSDDSSTSDSDSSDEETSSSEDSTSSEDEDSDDDEEQQADVTDPQNTPTTTAQKQETKQQTLKDMFAPKADECECLHSGPRFSIALVVKQ
jgi:hypothetical protein